jgi:dihydroneopterin aldolase
VSDRILLSGMTFYGHHGVSAREQEEGQVFSVDVAIEATLHRAGHSDDLADTLDYREVYSRIREVMTGERFRLLEAVAEAIAHRLLELDRVEAVTVAVRKPHVRLGGPLAYAGVEVTRRKGGGGP